MNLAASTPGAVNILVRNQVCFCMTCGGNIDS